jgi:hypothetical protein
MLQRSNPARGLLVVCRGRRRYLATLVVAVTSLPVLAHAEPSTAASAAPSATVVAVAAVADARVLEASPTTTYGSRCFRQRVVTSCAGSAVAWRPPRVRRRTQSHQGWHTRTSTVGAPSGRSRRMICVTGSTCRTTRLGRPERHVAPGAGLSLLDQERRAGPGSCGPGPLSVGGLLGGGSGEDPDGDGGEGESEDGDDGQAERGHGRGVVHSPDVVEAAAAVVDESVADQGEDMGEG